MKRSITFYILFLLFIWPFQTIHAQYIWEPDGLRIPGTWNDWNNETDMGGDFDLKKINTGTPRWTTTFHFEGETGQHMFKFVSTFEGNPWHNQWAGNQDMQLNTLDSFNYGTPSDPDNAVILNEDKWYTVVFEDSGYDNTRAIFMETSAAPVSITFVSVPEETIEADQPVPINITLADDPSPEEVFYLHFTRDNWHTSDIVTVSMTGLHGTAEIPGQPEGSTVQYAAFSSSVSDIEADYDLYAMQMNNKDGLYYSFVVEGIPDPDPDPEISWANLQWPPDGLIMPQQEYIVYGRVLIHGITGNDIPADGLQAWVGFSNEDASDPADFENGWTWIEADYNESIGTNDEYMADIGSDILEEGTYYYVTRFQYLDQEYVYGGYNNGFWNGTNNVSGVLTVSEETPDPEIGWANLQYPPEGDIEPEQEFLVYARIWIEGITGQDATTEDLEDLEAWIGFSTEDASATADFENGWTWIEASLDEWEEAFENNSQYSADIGSGITDEGTCYYVSRFRLNEGDYVYGGYSEEGGNFWDGENYVSGLLNVEEKIPEIGWANLQHPPNHIIKPEEEFIVYGRVWIKGITGENASPEDLEDLEAWIGFSTEDASETADFEHGWTWIEASLDDWEDTFANNSQYSANIGSGIADEGTYYYVSRFRLDDGDYVYGGYSRWDGHFWDGEDYVSGLLTVADEIPEIDWANLQYPPEGDIEPGKEFLVYGRVLIEDITGGAAPASGLQAWVGYNTEDTHPNTWTNWFTADYNSASGNNDEFMADIGSEILEEGTYYYATRFQHFDQDYVYGGYSAGGGNFWDGEDYVSGVLNVEEIIPEIGWANLQYPPEGDIDPEQEFIVYARIGIEGITGEDATAADLEELEAWIGFSTEDATIPADFENGWTWIEASLNDWEEAFDDNSQYSADIGTGITDEGIYYYVSRFRLDDGDFLYGGYSDGGGNFWDGENYVSGELNVEEKIPEIGWANLQYPPEGEIEPEQEFIVYGRVYVKNLTGENATTEDLEDLEAWIGYNTEDANDMEDFENGWTWIEASLNDWEEAFGDNSQYSADIGNGITDEGIYYYVSRFRLDDGDFVYGGYSDSGGNFWDSENYVSGELNVEEKIPEIGWVNLQYPPEGEIEPEQEFFVYARVYIKDLTGEDATTEDLEDIEAWIGYNTEDANDMEDFENGWTWIEASLDEWEEAFGNNSQYSADIGTGITDEGTYYYVSRFRLDEGDYVYGGYSEQGGNFWDGEDHVSGELTVEEKIPEIGWANLQYPPEGEIEPEQEFIVYARVYIKDLTGEDATTEDLEDLDSWIGFGIEDATDMEDFENGWTWIKASLNDWEEAFENNSQYSADIGSGITDEGTYYYVSRFRLDEGDYVYGGYSEEGGNFWDGGEYVSGILAVEEEDPDAYPVTFTIIDGTETHENIHFKGEMTDWSTLPMIEDPDHTWTLTLDVYPGTWEWGAIEDDGSESGIWLIEGPNLFVTVDYKGTVTGDTTYTTLITDIFEASTYRLKLYPNPANDFITLEGDIRSAEVSISDITGRLIKQEVIQGNANEIYIGNLQPGSYLVEVISEGGSKVFNLIKR